MKNSIEAIIKDYVRDYHKIKKIETKWKEPLVSFADAEDSLFYRLKEVVGPNHLMPQDLMEEAKSIIAYFLPFEDYIPNSNIEGKYSSRTWAVAYVETNELISDLNSHVQNEIGKLGYKSELIPATRNYDTNTLISNWSHRHVAYIAGLGKFGLNNMLITRNGCCGRIGTIVTNLEIEPTSRVDTEYCLYKYDKSCKKCVDKCVNNALTEEAFNRHKCREMCIINGETYKSLGSSDVCGKCLVGLPCSSRNPVEI